MNGADAVSRYLALVAWARTRYAGPDGCYVVRRGDGTEPPAARVERLAAARYLGLPKRESSKFSS